MRKVEIRKLITRNAKFSETRLDIAKSMILCKKNAKKLANNFNKVK